MMECYSAKLVELKADSTQSKLDLVSRYIAVARLLCVTSCYVARLL